MGATEHFLGQGEYILVARENILCPPLESFSGARQQFLGVSEIRISQMVCLPKYDIAQHLIGENICGLLKAKLILI